MPKVKKYTVTRGGMDLRRILSDLELNFSRSAYRANIRIFYRTSARNDDDTIILRRKKVAQSYSRDREFYIFFFTAKSAEEFEICDFDVIRVESVLLFYAGEVGGRKRERG